MAFDIFQLVGKISINHREVKSQLRDVGSQAQATGSGMNQIFGSVNKTLIGLGATAAVAIGATMVAALTSGFRHATDMNDAMRAFEVQTGASEAETQRFSQTLQSLMRVNTDSTEDLTNTLIEMRRRFGDLGEDTQRHAQTFLDFAKVSGVDNVAAVESVSRAMAVLNIDVDESADLMDKLFVASRDTGTEATRLADSVALNAPVFESMNIGLDDSIALLALFEAGGISGERASRALQGVMEITTDTTGKFAEQLDVLGIETDSAGRAMGSAEDIAFDLFRRLEEGSLTTEEYAAVSEIFGTRIGPKMVEALGAMNVSVDELSGSVQNSTGEVERASDAFDRTWAEAIELFKRQTWLPMIESISAVFLPIIEQAISLMEEWGPRVAPVMERVGQGVASVVEVGMTLLSWFLQIDGVVPGIATLIGVILVASLAAAATAAWALVAAKLAFLAPAILVGAAIATLVALIIWLRNNWHDLTQTVLTFITDTIQGFLNWASQLTGIITGWITDTLSAFAGWARDVLAAIVSMVTDVLSSFLAWRSNVLAIVAGFVADTLSAFVSWARGVLRAITSWVLDTVAAFTGWAQNVLAVITSWISSVIAAITSWAATMIAAFTSFVSQAVALFTSWRNSLMDLVRQAFNFIRDTFTVAALMTIFQSAFNAVLSWIAATVPSRILSAMRAALAHVRNTFTLSALMAIFQGSFGAAVDWILRVLPGRALQGARAIIDAFIRGIRAARARLTQAIRDILGPVADLVIGRSPVPEGPLSEIDISGERIMGSFAEGLEAGARDLVRTAGGIADRVQSALGLNPLQLDASLTHAIGGQAGALSSAASPAGGGASIVIEQIDITVPGGDADQISEELVDSIERVLAERFRFRLRGLAGR